jgi:hypothetical protein
MSDDSDDMSDSASTDWGSSSDEHVVNVGSEDDSESEGESYDSDYADSDDEDGEDDGG